MSIIILTIIIVIWASVVIADGLWADSFIDWVFAVFVGLVIGGVFILIAAMPLSYALPKTIRYEEKEILNIKDNLQTSGAFFLGSVVIDGIAKYSYYTKENGGFKLNYVDADDVLIKYGEKAYAKSESGCDGSFQWIAVCAYDSTTPVEIQVPDGTIKQNFVLDAN